MAKTDYKTIDEYHLAFPEDLRQRMQSIRELVHQVAPGAEEVISYQIPAFKTGKSYLIYYSAYAKHISLSSPWSAALLREFEEELKAFKVSRSAIQLPNDKPLPLDFVKRLLKFRKQETPLLK
jgi:uncharacterized protein YdhG (YjbR/CyaY superfamily)